MDKKIGIICAADTELEPFLPHIENCTVTEKAMLKFYEGEIGGIPIVTLYSGVCKVNAAVATQILIDTFHVDLVINAGTAGGMDPDVKIFDTIISDCTAYHDVDDEILTEFHPWMSSIYFHSDQTLLEAARHMAGQWGREYPVRIGIMVTGEKFIADDMRSSINESYHPLSVDMESAAVAHVCYVNKTPFISIRSITDDAFHTGGDYFEQNCETAAKIAKDVTIRFINML